MGDAAHVESLNHEVYRTPFAVEPPVESWKTPDNYKFSHIGPDALPEKMKVWLVQKTGKTGGGVVAPGEGFTDSPDAEILALGFNSGKAYGSVGIGRQGNFLQWGYSAPPSQMTEAGRKLFLNCVHYIRKFDSKAPLLRRWSLARSYGAFLVKVSSYRQSFLRALPMELQEKYQSDPNGLAAYYRANLEFVYYDKSFRIDEDLKSLGIKSNRTVETLERLFALRNDPAQREIVERLLARYTDGQTRFDFQTGRDRIYFSDVGGYKFFVVPEGYLVGPKKQAATSPAPSP